MEKGPEFLENMVKFFLPLLLNSDEEPVYRVFDGQLVVSSDKNEDFMHQDLRSGNRIFEFEFARDNDKYELDIDHSAGATKLAAPSALRLIFDIGRGIGEESRTFDFQRCKSGVHIYISMPRIVAMIWALAGMRRESPWFHGRFRGGVTFAMDVYLAWIGCTFLIFIHLSYI